MYASKLPCYVAGVHPTQPSPREFARLLAGIQQSTGLTYQGIADAAGVNRSQVWRWIHAGSAPGYEPVRRLAAHLIAQYPYLSDTASALLPAAGYETPPGMEGDPADADAAAAVTTAVVLAAISPIEAEVWAEVRGHPEGAPADVIFADAAERALWSRELTPERQRVKEISALRSVRARPPRALGNRRAG